MTTPVLDPSSPGSSAHPLRRGKLAALTTLALLGGTGCVAEVHTRTVTPAPATVTYQEFAVVEEPVVHIAAAPVHVEIYPRHVHHHHPHHVTTVRPSASVRASASVRPSASIRTAAPARPSVHRSG